MMWSTAAAQRIAGRLGFPSKMPGTSYGLPASACILGAKLAKIPGTPCATCYAFKDQMSWPNAQKAQHRRLASLSHPQWVDGMVALLSKAHANPTLRIDLGLRPGPKLWREGTRFRLNDMGYHRWHDSGDLQSVDHLRKICEVCTFTPKIRHWLPTQELSMVRQYLREGGAIPANLVIRVSSIRVNDTRTRNWPLTSSVFSDEAAAMGYPCPARHQGHRCMDCRACWSPDVAHVSYEVH